MEDIVVERYFDEPIDFDSFKGLKEKAPWCVELNRLHYFGTFLSPNHKDMYCHYRAPDAESFRAPSREHDVHFNRAWTARVTPGPGVPGLTTPAELVRLLCPVAFAVPTSEPPEPMPSVFTVYAEGESARSIDARVRFAPGRHLMAYHSMPGDRALLVCDRSSLAELTAYFDGLVVREVMIRTRHLRHARVRTEATQ